MSKFLVTGGAGYIGGVCVEEMVKKGDEVVVLDNLSVGHKENIHPKAAFYQGDTGDGALLDKIFKEHQIDTVLHFAAFALVGESVKEPSKYFHNNFAQGISLLDSMRRNGVDKFIFSSTCATYGIPDKSPIDENTPQRPINPYGESKLMLEKALKWYHSAYGMKYTIFRYFNACGATEQSMEVHEPETHLIPLIFDALMGKRPNITVFGTDYNTQDGSCIRDYIHVLDLIDAHLKAIDYMGSNFANEFNLGTGKGYSVKQVIDTVKRVTGKEIMVVLGERRPGDPDELVAKADKAFNELNWHPTHSDLEQVVASVWKAVQNPPKKIS